MLTTGCKQSGPRPVVPNPMTADPACGDGRVDDGEECDGSDFGQATCKSLGFDDGQLACDSSCRFVKTLCVTRCGNGRLDPGESCDGDAGLGACSTFGYPACAANCQVDTRHCVTPPFEDGPAFFMAKGGPTTIADLPPVGPPDLVMAVPAFGRIETFPWLAQQGFQQTQGRKLSFEVTPVAPWVTDFNGDGLNDVITLNDDGAIDALLAKTSGFTREPATALRCAGGQFIGSLALRCGSEVLVLFADAGTRVEALAPALVGGDVWRVLPLAVQRLPGPDFSSDGGTFSLTLTPSKIALADLDGDADLDLVTIDGDTVTVFERTSLDFAVKRSFSAPGASELALHDLDMDGKVDLIWFVASDAHIWRGSGAFVFTEFVVSLGANSPRLSTSFGDVDGDGDLDLAVTFSEGNDATRTNVRINRVR